MIISGHNSYCIILGVSTLESFQKMCFPLFGTVLCFWVCSASPWGSNIDGPRENLQPSNFFTLHFFWTSDKRKDLDNQIKLVLSLVCLSSMPRIRERCLFFSNIRFWNLSISTWLTKREMSFYGKSSVRDFVNYFKHVWSFLVTFLKVPRVFLYF